MRPEIRSLWLSALTRGQYRQGKFRLAKTSDTGQEFCCLGVLCEVARENGVDLEITEVESGDDWESERRYDGHESLLPGAVVLWAGLERNAIDIHSRADDRTVGMDRADIDPNQQYPIGWFGGYRVGLTRLDGLNDDGYSFEEIADQIREHL